MIRKRSVHGRIAYQVGQTQETLPIPTLGLAGAASLAAADFTRFYITLDAGEDRVFGKAACSACNSDNQPACPSLCSGAQQSDIPKQSGVMCIRRQGIPGAQGRSDPSL